MQTWVLILLAWPHLPTLCKGPDIPHLASKVFGSLQTTWLIKRDDECVTSFEPESLAAATSGTRTWCWLFLRLIAGALGTLRVMSSCQTLGHGCSLTRVHYHLNAESLLRYRSSQIEASCVRAALSLHFQLWPVFCSTGGYGGRCTGEREVKASLSPEKTCLRWEWEQSADLSAVNPNSQVCCSF